MRPIITVVGSLLLAGNLLLAVPLRQNTLAIRTAEQTDRQMRKAIIEHLVDRGLEVSTAEHLVTEHFGAQGEAFSQALLHIAILFPEVKREAIVKDVATRILHRETIALADYDYLVGMLSRLNGVALPASHYDRIRECVLLNRTLFRS